MTSKASDSSVMSKCNYYGVTCTKKNMNNIILILLLERHVVLKFSDFPLCLGRNKQNNVSTSDICIGNSTTEYNL